MCLHCLEYLGCALSGRPVRFSLSRVSPAVGVSTVVEVANVLMSVKIVSSVSSAWGGSHTTGALTWMGGGLTVELAKWNALRLDPARLFRRRLRSFDASWAPLKQ